MENTNSQYLLLFRGPDWDQGVSNEEVEQRMNKVLAWFDSLKQRGIIKGGEALERSGTTVTAIKDGPYAESKEAVGGYLLIEVDSFEDALAVAKSNPTLAYGITIEVRPVADDCPCFKRVRQRLSLAAA